MTRSACHSHLFDNHSSIESRRTKVWLATPLVFPLGAKLYRAPHVMFALYIPPDTILEAMASKTNPATGLQALRATIRLNLAIRARLSSILLAAVRIPAPYAQLMDDRPSHLASKRGSSSLKVVRQARCHSVLSKRDTLESTIRSLRSPFVDDRGSIKSRGKPRQ